jgi:hypothetical protein
VLLDVALAARAVPPRGTAGAVAGAVAYARRTHSAVHGGVGGAVGVAGAVGGVTRGLFEVAHVAPARGTLDPELVHAVAAHLQTPTTHNRPAPGEIHELAMRCPSYELGEPDWCGQPIMRGRCGQP